MDLPARKYTPQLGTRTAEVDRLDERYENAKVMAIAETISSNYLPPREGVLKCK
jgi:hypothetical protein